MPDLTLVWACSPILLCGFIILILRRSAAIGALSGIALAVGLSMLLPEFNIDMKGIRTMLGTTAILSLSAFLVVLPGLYLNAILRGQGVIDDLVVCIQSIRIQSEPKTLLLLLGILPAVESMTGFGVSLLLGIPIFFRLFSPDRAYRLSLLGLSTMPWGSLALATVVGASLTGYSLVELGAATALTSSMVFPMIGLIALFVIGGGSLLRQYGLAAVLLGLGLSISLYFFNRWGFVETAGIFAGLTMSVIGFFLFRTASNSAALASEATSLTTPVLHILFPYGLLLLLLCLFRMVPVLHNWLAELLILAVGRVKFAVFTSPGLALTVAAIIILLLRPVKIDHKIVWERTVTALFSLCCFILLAQFMSESHMISAFAQALGKMKGNDTILALLSSLLGMMSGFITGSNLGGNALAIGMQQQIGNATGNGLLFSALQNSASGNAVFISLPIIILVMTIAKDAINKKDDSPATAEHELLLFGLRAGFFIYAALLLSFVIASEILKIHK
jgi:lactate permease